MIKQAINLQPFKTPNFVLVVPTIGERNEGFKETPKFALKELDASTLDQLCSQFRRDIFAKAEKSDPKI